MCKNSILLLAIVISSNCFAYLPPAPSMGSMGSTEVRSGSTSCRSDLGGNMMVYGGAYDNNSDSDYYNSSNDTGVSIGIAYRFGGVEPLDCSKLYNKELTLKDIQISKMQAELEALRKLTEKQNKIDGGLIPPPPL